VALCGGARETTAEQWTLDILPGYSSFVNDMLRVGRLGELHCDFTSIIVLPVITRNPALALPDCQGLHEAHRASSASQSHPHRSDRVPRRLTSDHDTSLLRNVGTALLLPC
jgi:hypothetical protein